MFIQSTEDLVLVPAVLALLIAFLGTPLAIRFAWKYGLIDDPKKHKHPKVIHSHPTPRGGVLSLFFAILIPSLFFLPLDKHTIGILIGGLIILLMGLADDKWNLNPYLRLFLQLTAAFAPIVAGIGIAFIANPFGGIIDLSQLRVDINFLGQERSIWIISDLFALFWIVFIMNILNMGAKGIDGQLTGIVAIAAAVVGFLSLRYSADITQWPIIILASITVGAFLGFLPWHIYPQKIMPSFGGANLGGFLLAVLSILSTTKVGTLAVVLGIPLIDTGYTIVRRIASGKSPVWGDRGHLHHKLLDSGWSKPKVSLFYWILTIVLGIVAINLNASSKFYTIIGVSFFVGALILWLTYKPKSSK